MNKRNWPLAVVIGAMLLASWTGCHKPAGSESDGDKSGKHPSMRETYIKGLAEQKQKQKEEPADTAEVPPVKPVKPVAPPEPPQALTMPEVKLDKQLLDTCVVKVGDTMPDAELPDLQGKRASLHTLAGKKATVLLFWTSSDDYAKQALGDLDEFAKPFAGKEINIVGIDVKDSSDAAHKAVTEAGAKYVNLLDADGSYFAKVAKTKMPRVYLLAPSGKILWFDVEFSPASQRDLERGIKVVLGEK